jgi:hypothetical protein
MWFVASIEESTTMDFPATFKCMISESVSGIAYNYAPPPQKEKRTKFRTPFPVSLPLFRRGHVEQIADQGQFLGSRR